MTTTPVSKSERGKSVTLDGAPAKITVVTPQFVRVDLSDHSRSVEFTHPTAERALAAGGVFRTRP